MDKPSSQPALPPRLRRLISWHNQLIGKLCPRPISHFLDFLQITFFFICQAFSIMFCFCLLSKITYSLSFPSPTRCLKEMTLSKASDWLNLDLIMRNIPPLLKSEIWSSWVLFSVPLRSTLFTHTPHLLNWLFFFPTRNCQGNALSLQKCLLSLQY